MSENINQNGPQQPATPTPEASGGQRTFTQEEVNRIVADRLARERAKTGPSPADEREQALKAREAKLDCREYLDSVKLPAELLELLDSSDVERFKQAAGRLTAVFPAIAGSIKREGWKPGESAHSGAAPDLIAEAFKPKS